MVSPDRGGIHRVYMENGDTYDLEGMPEYRMAEASRPFACSIYGRALTSSR
jgi:hypothetical protein